MISKYFGVCAAFGLGLMSISQAHAQVKSMGQFEYENSCAACHGLSGTGGGPSAQFLAGGTAPDLTVIQENYGGVFPVDGLYSIIEGTARQTSVHGSTEMPIWGDRYRQRTQDTQGGDPFSPEERDIYVKTRILALIEYLHSIQRE